MALRKCWRCGKLVDQDSRFLVGEMKAPRCPKCIFMAAAKRHLRCTYKWIQLRNLFLAQKGLCAYSGQPLRLGENANIDHRIPRARGGSSELSNLQWVLTTINDLKRDMDHDEFVALCRQVADAQDNAWPTPDE